VFLPAGSKPPKGYTYIGRFEFDKTSTRRSVFFDAYRKN
jgi:hypothetical protein